MSKQTKQQRLAEHVGKQITAIVDRWGFDRTNGWAQVDGCMRKAWKRDAHLVDPIERSAGKRDGYRDEAMRDYGVFEALTTLATEFDLWKLMGGAS